MAQCLITGGAGFIGSHLSEALLAEGHRVVVVDDQSTGRLANLDAVADHPNFRFVAGSVSDKHLVRELVAQADQVYHLAAAVGVALISKEPIETIERDMDRDRFMSAEEAKAYGIIDSVFTPQKELVPHSNGKET
jgi:UDP-glucose 4-epimerase